MRCQPKTLLAVFVAQSAALTPMPISPLTADMLTADDTIVIEHLIHLHGELARQIVPRKGAEPILRV